jgi:tetratricopeptide (TPR) repeat protein
MASAETSLYQLASQWYKQNNNSMDNNNNGSIHQNEPPEQDDTYNESSTAPTLIDEEGGAGAAAAGSASASDDDDNENTTQDNTSTSNITEALPSSYPTMLEFLRHGDMMFYGLMIRHARYMYEQVIEGHYAYVGSPDTSADEYPLYVQALCNRLTCMARLGHTQHAKKQLTDLTDCHQETATQIPAFFNGRAQLYYMDLAYREAAREIAQSLALQKDPRENPEAYRIRGLIAWAVQQYKVALQSWDQLSPRNAEAQRLKARVYCDIERPSTAIDVVDNALQLNKQCVALYHVRGFALCKLRRFEEAVNTYDVALRLSQEKSSLVSSTKMQSTLHAEKGTAFYFLEKYRKAEGCYRNAIDQNPNNFLAHYNLATLALRRQNYQRALNHAERSLGIVADDRNALELRAELLVLLQRPEDACQAADDGLRVVGESGSLSLRLAKARALLALDRPQESLDEYTEVYNQDKSTHPSGFDPDKEFQQVYDALRKHKASTNEA